MTNGEALEQIKQNIWFKGNLLKKHKELRDYKEAVDIAMQALEKQIQKPVVLSTVDYPRCPVCRRYVGIDIEEMYCSACGQALDWEGEEDV